MLIGLRVHPRPINTAQGLLKWVKGSLYSIHNTNFATVQQSSDSRQQLSWSVSTNFYVSSPASLCTTVTLILDDCIQGKCAAANRGSCALCSTLAPKLVFLTIIIKNFYQENHSSVHHTIHSVVVYITHTCAMGPNKCST